LFLLEEERQQEEPLAQQGQLAAVQWAVVARQLAH